MIQGSDEWKALRVGRVTASRIGSIMGWSPYQTRADVLREMVRQHLGDETAAATDTQIRNYIAQHGQSLP
jgi:predicted phage-related endonuclease